jgi:isoleucyl-tRNA synthetase
VNIKVRQQLQKIIIPVLDKEMAKHIEAVRALIMGEVNVKDIELITDTTGIITKRIKPNFKTLGAKCGKYMKQVAALVASFTQEQIAAVENGTLTTLDMGAESIEVSAADFEITSEDMPGWLVTSEGKLTVALDITLTPELEKEGVARELINRIQNLRKSSGFDVTDKITVSVYADGVDAEDISSALETFADYVCAQTLSTAISAKGLAEAGEGAADVEWGEGSIKIEVVKNK